MLSPALPGCGGEGGAFELLVAQTERPFSAVKVTGLLESRDMLVIWLYNRLTYRPEARRSVGDHFDADRHRSRPEAIIGLWTINSTNGGDYNS